MIPTLAIIAYIVAGLVLVAAMFTFEADGEELNPGMFIAAVALWPVLLAIVGVMAAREWWAR